jgi:hypothetical protein
VAQAVSNLYARNREYKAAKDRKESTTEITLALQAARDLERAVVRAYDDHTKKHGCKSCVVWRSDAHISQGCRLRPTR